MYALRGQVIQLQNIGSLASVTIEAKAIVRSRGGSTQSLTIEAFTAQSDRTLSDLVPSDERTRSEGEVVAASVRLVTGAPVRGQLFVILSVRGGPELCRGYLVSGVNLGQFEDSLSGRGLMRSLDLDDPAANTEFTAQTVPTNAVWMIRGFGADLVTDAQATDRHFRFNITDGTDSVGGYGGTQVHDPSRTMHYVLVAGGRVAPTNATMADDRTIGMSGVPGPYPGGYVINFVTSGIRAGDNWGQGQLLVEEWLVA